MITVRPTVCLIFLSWSYNLGLLYECKTKSTNKIKQLIRLNKLGLGLIDLRLT